VQQFAADDPGLMPIYQAAFERQKPVIIHTGTAPYPPGSPYLGLDHLEKVMLTWPELKVVIPHLGLNEMDKAFSFVERYPNVYLDTSWVLDKPELKIPLERLAAFMERFPQRFLYGSDFPILDRKPEYGLEALLQLGLSKTTLQNVLTKNACQLLKHD